MVVVVYVFCVDGEWLFEGVELVDECVDVVYVCEIVGVWVCFMCIE